MGKRYNRLIILVTMLVIVIGCTATSNAADYVSEGVFSAARADKINSFLNDDRWSNGTTWSPSHAPELEVPKGVYVSGCTAYCTDFINYVYGKTDVRSGCAFKDPNEIQAGDLIYIDGNDADTPEHWFIVLGRGDDGSLMTAEGNYAGKVVIRDDGYRLDEDAASEEVTLHDPSIYGREFVVGWHYEQSPVKYSNDTTLNVTLSKKYAPQTSGVTMNFGGENNGIYTVAIYKRGDGKRVLIDVVKGPSFSFNENDSAGYYACVTAYGKSTITSDKIYFGIYKSGHSHKWRSESDKAGYLHDGYSCERCDCCGTTRNYVTKPGYSTSYVQNFSVTKGTKSFKAKWTKQSSANQAKFSGYQVQYATKSSMAGGKIVSVSKSASYKKVSKLKAKKKYYVRVRTYKTVNGKKYYSKWSKYKAVTTK